MFPEALRHRLELETGCQLENATPVAGGDINQAFRIRCTSGRQMLVKFNAAGDAVEMFRTEALGLALLGASKVIRVPKVIHRGEDSEQTAYMLLEYIESGNKTLVFWERFGIALANLHGNTSEQYGFSHDNYIGRLAQSNTRNPSWPDFFAKERLSPQMEMALNAGLMGRSDQQLLDKLCRRLDSIFPPEPPSLVHGDLWNGNFLCDTEGQPVLIDPAAHFANREVDLAMAKLFGGFDDRFFKAYQEYWPLAPGFDDRVDVYQLYYILVHVNLFGGSYVHSARSILQKWGK